MPTPADSALGVYRCEFFLSDLTALDTRISKTDRRLLFSSIYCQARAIRSFKETIPVVNEKNASTPTFVSFKLSLW